MVIAVRNEVPSDAAALHRLHKEAFGREEEARLVETLRWDGDLVPGLSFVAESEGRIVGHLLFTTLSAPARSPLALALAPLSVSPEFQKKGIGAQLVSAGLKRARKLGFQIAVVLGEPKYYGRFGFSVELGKKIVCPYSGAHLMALELEKGALRRVERLEVAYPKAFEVS
ncbi:MAG TPA: N-acetyltransferase [bacterium]|nr:N-acetyltransferase [bacterium]